MNPIKEKNIVAACLMDETDTNKLWQLIRDNFPSRSWDNIEETVQVKVYTGIKSRQRRYSIVGEQAASYEKRG